MSTDPKTVESNRLQLHSTAVRALLASALLQEMLRHGLEAAQRLHDDLAEGKTTLAFEVRMEATGASLVGIERRGQGSRCVLDELLHARPDPFNMPSLGAAH